MEPNVQKLIAESCKGSQAAQRQLYERYKDKVFGLCMRYARDYPEAKDMFQEAFITLFRDLPRYRGEGVFEGWMHRLTVRTALQFLRRKSPLRFAEDFSELPERHLTVEPDSDLTASMVLHHVQQLPDGYRTVFNLHCLEGWSYQEIATELGIQESTVRSQYTRACSQLRQWIENSIIFEKIKQ